MKSFKRIGLTAVVAVVASLVMVGCASFSTNTFRAEQTAVNMAFTAYQGWTNYLALFPVSAERSNAVKTARLQFAATVGTVEALRVAYETNSAVKPQLQATLLTLADQSSNVVWLVNFFQAQQAKRFVLVTNVYQIEVK
jgi:hypothetical protein